jgi:hypothetical protein
MSKSLKVRWTQSHDFDPAYVIDLIKDEKVGYEDAKRILANACNVIMRARSDMEYVFSRLDAAHGVAQSVKDDNRKCRRKK